MRAFIFVLLALFASLSHAIVTPLTQANIQNLVAAHNTARAGVSPAALTAIPTVVWDNTVALSAEANVQRCNFTHQSGNFGENLSGGSTSNFPEPGWENIVVNDWVSENVSYNVYSNTCNDTQTLCLHYTQVVWANTTKIGCARADQCASPTNTIISCQYDPPGNFIGQQPYFAVSQSMAPQVSQSGAAPSSQVAQVSQSGAAPSSQVAQVSQSGAPSSQVAQVSQSGAAPSSQVAQVSQSGAAPSSQVAQVSQSGAGSSKAGQSQSGAGQSQSGAAPSSQVAQVSQSAAAASSQVAQQTKTPTGSQSRTPSKTKDVVSSQSQAQVSASPTRAANVTPTRSPKAANTRPTKPQRIACRQNCHQAFLSCKRTSNVRQCKRTKKTCVAACIAPQ